MHPDDPTTETAGQGGPDRRADDCAADRRERENDVVRELSEVTARHSPQPSLGRDREKPRGTSSQ